MHGESIVSFFRIVLVVIGDDLATAVFLPTKTDTRERCRQSTRLHIHIRFNITHSDARESVTQSGRGCSKEVSPSRPLFSWESFVVIIDDLTTAVSLPTKMDKWRCRRSPRLLTTDTQSGRGPAGDEDASPDCPSSQACRACRQVVRN